LFLICSFIRIILSTFAAEITSKKRNYAPNKETRESQGADPSSDERIGRRQQKFVSRHIPQRQAVV
uniref:hypothetical protein n=1 Tax=Barnesiella intestinihominis TaxID=487174 RepID=UPI003FED8A72